MIATHAERVRISMVLWNPHNQKSNLKSSPSLECVGCARDPAKVEDQVRFLAWTLRPIACECDGCTTDFESVRRGSIPWRATWLTGNRRQSQTIGTRICWSYGAVTLTGKAIWFKTRCLRVRTPLALLEERRVMMNTNQRNSNFKAREPESAFVLQLANGKAKSFESAEALAKWMSHQRGLEYRNSANASRRKAGRRHAARRRNRRVSTVASLALRDAAPLARYAKRNSNEA